MPRLNARLLLRALEQRITPDTTPHNLAVSSFSQNWATTTLISADDDWSGVPSVIGYFGEDTFGEGLDPQTVLTPSASVNVLANQGSTTITAGGVAEFDVLANSVVALQASGNADAPNLVIVLNTTGRANIAISYNLRDIDGTGDNAIQPVALQYRIGNAGDFVNVPSGFVADATTGPSLATLVTPVSVTLPSAVEYQPHVQVRIITSNAVGSDEWVGVDDIQVTSIVGKIGNEFPINTYTTSSQSNPSVAVDADGDAVVVWSSIGQDGSGYGVYGQRFNSTGAKVGGEFPINTYTTSTQSNPSVALDADGDAVVVWSSFGQDGSVYGIYGQRFNAAGAKVGGEFPINTYTTSNQQRATVAVDADGDAVVVWESFGQDGSSYGIYGQRFNAAGAKVGGEFPINTYTTSRQSFPSVAVDADGDAVVVWQSYGQDGQFDGIYGQRFNSAGAKVGGEFPINTYTTNDQILPSVAMDADGDTVVVWQSYGQDGGLYGIYGQRFNSAGAKVGGEFPINTYTTNNQRDPSVAMDADGDAVVVWESDGQDGSSNGIYGQRFNSAGTKVGGEFPINTYTTNIQIYPSVAVDADGDAVVVWHSIGQDGEGFGVYGQRFASIPDTPPHVLALSNFAQNWATTTQISADDDWSGVPSIIGFFGDDAFAEGVNPQTVLTPYAGVNVLANQGSTTITSGGVAEFDGLADPVVALQGSGIADAPNLVIYLNTIGRINISISYNLRDIDGTADNAIQPVALQYRIGNAGNFVNVPGGFVADATTGPNLATLVTPVSVTLPGAVENQAQVQVRIITTNAVGPDEWVGIDDIQVTSIGKVGNEFAINTYITGNQNAFGRTVAVDANGDAVVVWTSESQDGSFSGIYGQRFDAVGAKVGGEFPINTYTTGDQRSPSVAVDAYGDAVVVWHSQGQDGNGYGIYGQRFNSAGAKVGGEFPINTYTTSNQQRATVAVDADGDAVVVWQSAGQDGSNYGVYGQRFNSAGAKVGGEFPINTYTTGSQSIASVAVDADGDAVVVWYSSGQDGSGYGVYGQRFNSAGAKVGGEFPINTYTTNHQSVPSVAVDADGDAVVVWQSYGQDGGLYGIYGQRFNSAGAKVGGEFPINTYTTSNQNFSSVAADADGDAVVVWQSNGQDGSFAGIYGQRFNSAGTKVGGEFPINTYTTSNQNFSSVAVDADGDAVVVWQSNGQDGSGYGIYGQRFSAIPHTAPHVLALSNFAQNWATTTQISVDNDWSGVPSIIGFLGDDALAEGVNPQTVLTPYAGVNVLSNQGSTTITSGGVAEFDGLANPVVALQGSGIADAPNLVIYLNTIGRINISISYNLRDIDGTADNAIQPVALQYRIGNAGNFVNVPGGFVADATTGPNLATLVTPVSVTLPSAVENQALVQVRIVTANAVGPDEWVGIDDIQVTSIAAKVGNEFAINTFTTGNQFLFGRTMAVDADGDAVVVWYSSGQDGSGYGVYGQRFNSAGAKVGGEFPINTYMTNHQSVPSVAVDADGDAVVVWQSDGQDGGLYGIYGQRFNSAGAKVGGEFPINTYTTSNQLFPSVAVDADGDAVVVWESSGQDGSSYGIYGQRFNSAGTKVGGEFPINTYTTSNQNFSSVAVDADGDAVVVWHSNGQDGSDYGVYGQRFNSAGAKVGGEFPINTYTTNRQGFPSVAVDADGDAVVVWHNNGQDGSDYGVYGQRFNSAGAKVGGEFPINTYTTNRQSFPSVAVDADGDAVVVWQSNGQDGDSYGIYGQRFNSAGAKHGGEFTINTYTTFSQGLPSVAVDADGDAVVVWHSYSQDGNGYGIYGQRFASPNPATVAAKFSNLQVNPGAPGVQRSMVTSLKLAFDSPVSFTGSPSAAFSLVNQKTTNVTTLSAAVDVSGTVVTLTFTGGSVDLGGSLSDGRYTLTIIAGQFTGSGFDGNGDGTAGDNYVLIGSPANGLFRLFGDSDGDGNVAANDFIQFRLALGGNSPVFDFDNDGAVAASDFIQFRLRFGGSI